MEEKVALSADERSVLLYCLGSYHERILRSESVLDQLIEALTLTAKNTKNLMETIYREQALSVEQCEQAQFALLGLRAMGGEEGELPIDGIEARLKRAASLRI